jgi:hypothetical protein
VRADPNGITPDLEARQRLENERQWLWTLLDDAKCAADATVSPCRWWWGTDIERAWRDLREVEERLVDFAQGESSILEPTMPWPEPRPATCQTAIPAFFICRT